ncbi:MAG: xanthine dehydrogenase family protein subunit M [Thermodesulfobacteriota bacterium]
MLLPRFDFHAPTTLDEACQILARYRDKAKVLAGGTDLLVNMKNKLLAPDHVVTLDRLAELEGLDTGRDEVFIGARTTAAALAGSRALRNGLGVLAAGAAVLGSPLIRNRATIGGNVVNARPASDLGPPLLALGARAVLVSAAGGREAPLEDFWLGPGKTVIRPDEILTRLAVPRPGPGTGGGYEKLSLRRTLEIALVNVAAVITLSPRGDRIKSARVVLAAVAPTVVRSPGAEKALIGKVPGPKSFAAAAQAAALDAKPIDDHRSSAEYRRLMVEVLTRRALEKALAQARG